MDTDLNKTVDFAIPLLLEDVEPLGTAPGTRAQFSLKPLYRHLLSADQQSQVTPPDVADGSSYINGLLRRWRGEDDFSDEVREQTEPLALSATGGPKVRFALVVRDGRTTSALELGLHEIIRVERKDVDSWKACKHGLRGVMASQKTCLVVQALQSVCAKVERREPGMEWQLAGTLEDAGCTRRPSPVFTYVTLRSPIRKRGAELPLLPRRVLDSARLAVRSSMDPELLASNLDPLHRSTLNRGRISNIGDALLFCAAILLIVALVRVRWRGAQAPP
eukprot:CAMPEP_0177598374 /NCGR_PEP_ID=MMETSP0419_2-20121207/12307_1 /TAXON_ID=582737 /ORGANISM="Tetraselmis sp., Strain GSL018" /LENGTH=276 /DNA_ID=CAMNT_0019090799 /DNA_START=241 /DNA_END=1072 /DNA_ORIENTATION=+